MYMYTCISQKIIIPVQNATRKNGKCGDIQKNTQNFTHAEKGENQTNKKCKKHDICRWKVHIIKRGDFSKLYHLFTNLFFLFYYTK